MASIEEKIIHEISWRTNEISIIKTIPFLFPFSQRQKEVLKKLTIPTFYSLWEGFVVECFSIYSRQLNTLGLLGQQVNINILAHSIDLKYRLKNPRTDFDKQVSLVKDICGHIDKEIELPISIPTESNVNYKVINAILCRFNLECLPQTPFETQLNRLLFFRNKLAHGENNIPITQNLIDEMSLTVISLMHVLLEKILEGYTRKSYLL